MNSKKKIIIAICICLFIIGAILCCIAFPKITGMANNMIENIEEQQTEQNVTTNTQESENVETNVKQEVPKDLKIYDIEEGYLTVPYNTKAIKHTYNWNNLSAGSNGYYTYNDNLYETEFGIDVSEFQGDINWKKVKEAGVKFAFIRLGYRGYAGSGKLVLDSKFAQNVNQASKNEIKIGIYFFSQAITVAEAKEEANYVLNNIKGKDITYPVCFDLEKIKFDTARTDNLTSEQITKMFLAFCEEIEKAGYTPLVYGNAKTFTTRMQLEELNNYKKWYADYQSTPLYPYDFTFWQYSEKGMVNGINGNVDLNLQFVLKK